MKTILLTLCLSLAAAALPSAAAAPSLGPAEAPPHAGFQNIVPAIPAGCIRAYYNSSMYGWYGFQNNCAQPVHLTWIANNPNDNFGAASGDVPAGQSANTGWSQSEIQRKQGLSIFVCPSGYIAVNSATQQPVRSATEDYVCKQW